MPRDFGVGPWCESLRSGWRGVASAIELPAMMSRVIWDESSWREGEVDSPRRNSRSRSRERVEPLSPVMPRPLTMATLPLPLALPFDVVDSPSAGFGARSAAMGCEGRSGTLMSMTSKSPSAFSVPITAMMQPVTRSSVSSATPMSRNRPDSSSSMILSCPLGFRYFSRGGGAAIQCCRPCQLQIPPLVDSWP